MSSGTNEAVAFSTAVDGFARAFRSRLNAAALAELRAIGLDLDRPLPAYPLATWEKVLMVTGRLLYPARSPQQGWQHVGHDFVSGYTQTLLGAAILAMNKIIGPRRSMERIGKNLRTGGNFATVVVRPISANEIELESALEPAFAPAWAGLEMVMHPFRLGLLQGSLTLLGQEGSVEMEAVDAQRQAARYRIRWRG